MRSIPYEGGLSEGTVGWVTSLTDCTGGPRNGRGTRGEVGQCDLSDE